MLIFDCGDNGGVSINKIIVKSDTIPTAGKKYKNAVYQYVGETNLTYTHGYIYECTETLTPDATILLEPHKIVFDEGDLVSFFETAGDTNHEVVSGRFKYLEGGDIWNINGLDSEENVVFSNYQVYTQDLIDAGFVVIDPSIADDEEINYELVYTQNASYDWNRIDVQPSIINSDGEAVVETPDGSNEYAVVNVKYVNNVVGTIEDVLETI